MRVKNVAEKTVRWLLYIRLFNIGDLKFMQTRKGIDKRAKPITFWSGSFILH